MVSLCHFFGVEGRVKIFRGEQPQGDGGLFEGDVFLVGLLGDLGPVLIAHDGGQGGDGHEGAVEIVCHLLPVGREALEAPLGEGRDAVGQQAHGLQIVVGHDGHVDVQLKVALGGGDAHHGIVAHDLDGHHGQRLALGGVHFAGHDGGAGFVFRDENFTQPAPGAGGQPAHVVGDLHEVCRQGL